MENNKQKIAVSALFTVALLFASQYLYARAGGGHGSGGSGSGGFGGLLFKILILPFAVIYVLVKQYNIRNKKKESLQIIVQAAQEDNFWDAAKMQDTAKKMFFKMQNAWMDRDLTKLKKELTDDFFEISQAQLDNLKYRGEKNILEDITVSEITIISSEDYKDNEKDAFVVYITGEMIDYTIKEDTNKIINNQEQKKESFSDTYHFIRHGNHWLLNNINNDVSLSDITDAINYKE